MTKTYYQFLEKKNKIQDTERTSKKNILFIMEELITYQRIYNINTN